MLTTEQLSDVEAEDRLLEKISTINEKLQAPQTLRDRLTYVLDQVRAGRCSLQLPHAERDPAPVHPPT